ncbi:glycosyl hydrolase 115 family protein [Steroidobacter sp. S1-65]|uniref:Glycosyl hydrolase 115 family protein n=1 Tax=Steroidobacter gossypii TaxID=2805490 RepID=A0ABS1WVP1_9GAMM|nr:glycosyl hydrolase 115 family protein [Steroidobacter gossypii]MBM0105017.1 glycosyl hydrolase 115 family protein [Steroidobacter gossypii]
MQHVAENFAADLERVGGKAARRITSAGEASGNVVVIGVLGQSAVIEELVRAGKLDAHDIAGEWEAFRQIVVEHPLPNVARALVIVGSDRRGAVYGTYDISEKIGVSPWYWFADVPVRRQANVYITAGSHRDAPKVKYRGFFINDEDPAFSSWANKRFGGINARMYEHVFELLLRLKGNYLWPAMWPPKAFNDDDPQNKIVADAMGVVMGTSHHEPMTRAHDEWHRNKEQGVTGGKWDYGTNAANLRAFWRGGIERMMSKGNGERYESLVTIGMRGDGDEAMAESTATRLLETIVADQRRIIEEVTGRPADHTPQVWALYKEVQDYYDHGMNVPDDVTLLFADDNWGQIRRLPTSNLDRKGGYGVYYHFDYVGAPRNYKWLNTVQIEKTWQQMDLAYARGARTLWIVNVGDIKPMEFPLSFFMDHAWNPEAMTLDALERYPRDWARATFGASQADAIADLITRYSKYAARRKPEFIDASSFRLGEGVGDTLNGGEFGALVAELHDLELDMMKVKAALPKDQRAAYLQLVEHPIAALSNLYQLYYAVAWNRRLAAAGDARANAFADQALEKFHRDQALTDNYHRVNGGKWDGMMSQTHIGYTNWQSPPTQVMPEVTRIPAQSVAKPIVFASGPVHDEASDVIAIEAPHYTRAVNGSGLEWRTIPNLGRTLGGITAFPQGRGPTTQQDAVRVEFDIEVRRAGDLTVQLYLSPTLDTTDRGSLRIGVSIDDRPMQTLIDKLLPSPTATTLQEQRDWNRAVEDNARILQAAFPDIGAGKHTLKIWRLDDNVVIEKVVASTGPIPLTYLGPSPREPRPSAALRP